MLLCLLSESSSGREKAETHDLDLKISASKLGFSFWGFLWIYVTLFEITACVIWGFIRGNGKWSGFSELIWLRGMSASQHIPCDTQRDKNSNTVRLTQKKRQNRKRDDKRRQWREMCRQAGWDMCSAASWVSEISLSFIITHAVCLPVSQSAGLCFSNQTVVQVGEWASCKIARRLKGQEGDVGEREREARKVYIKRWKSFAWSLCLQFKKLCPLPLQFQWCLRDGFWKLLCPNESGGWMKKTHDCCKSCSLSFVSDFRWML